MTEDTTYVRVTKALKSYMEAHTISAEFLKAQKDELFYGTGFFKLTKDGIRHVPFEEVMGLKSSRKQP